MNSSTHIIFLILFSFGFLFASGQKKVKEQEQAKPKYQPYHRVGIGLSNAHIPHGVNPFGETKWQVAGGWGLDYYYHFHKTISFGVQIDMIMQDSEVKRHLDDNTPEAVTGRSYPLSLCPVITYKPVRNLNFIIGSGTEYCVEGPMFVSTFGLEYGKEFNDNFEFGAGLTYSVKWSVYDTYMISFIISKKLFKKKKS